MEMWPEKSLDKNMCIILIKKKKKKFYLPENDERT